MYPGFGPQKVEMNKRTGSAVPSKEYEAMKRSMLQQDAQSIAYKGAGQALEGNRDPLYGNVNVPGLTQGCLLYTSPSPRDYAASRMPSSA